MLIFLRDCAVDLRVGVYESEMQAAQPVLINVTMEAPLPHHYDDTTERNLDRVVSYEVVRNFIVNDLTRSGHIGLLETAAEKIADFCLSDGRVTCVHVRIEKTAVFVESKGAGIELVRRRS